MNERPQADSPSAVPPEARDHAEAIRAGDRRALARAITWIESTREDHQALAQAILEALVADTGGATRLGITGPPGVGKSTFIESLGLHLLDAGHRVAVLAVDPSSPVTGGSILGDKTRMEQLALDERAFIRPSPSRGALGGVAHRTREALLLCEAAGFGVVIVETVGIGQSEVAVRSLVDTFLLLLQPGSGDELQGIKKGALELADLLVVNKADGEQKSSADRTRGEHEMALQLLRPSSSAWKPQVLSVSSLERHGFAEVWEAVRAHRQALADAGELETRRRAQARRWMWALVEEGLQQAFRRHPGVEAQVDRWERAVEAQEATPAAGARALLRAFEDDA